MDEQNDIVDDKNIFQGQAPMEVMMVFEEEKPSKEELINDPKLFNSEFIGKVFLALICFLLSVFLLISIFDKNKTISERENRTLAPRPTFNLTELLDGKLIPEFETHYSDTFPFRDFFLDVNTKITKITSQFSVGDDDVVIINSNKTEDDFRGESLDDVSGK